MKVEIEIPDGYELKAYAVPDEGEPIIGLGGGFWPAADKSWARENTKVFILRKIAPPEPKYRAWKCESEVPAELLWLQPVKGASRGLRIIAVFISRFGIMTVERKGDIPWDELLSDWKWSPDGHEWFKCGIQE